MANLQRLLRQAIRFIRRNPAKAERHLHTVGETLKKRTGGRYNRHIDKATGAASRYLAKQSGRRGYGAARDRGYGAGGAVPRYRADGRDHRRYR
ncbi:antitoxin [Streptomonospora sp. PA3]|uniref:antitoxin n=1 Tax=Streptomonospora sp. PA3 TaxID=2607326 RepID=UPI0012DD54ED|nr:antitoxin [Streptomonospora sp. PA3]MUL41487.1 antitoxin [Streptomonospora sp. PA3]